MIQSWESRENASHLKSNKKFKYIEILEMLHEKELFLSVLLVYIIQSISME